MSKLALLGGRAVRTKPWPGWPVWDDGEKKALIRVLESGSWCRVPRGTEIPKFEKEYAKYRDAEESGQSWRVIVPIDTPETASSGGSHASVPAQYRVVG